MTQETEPVALAGAVAGFRMLQDGSIRVSLDFEPKDREVAMRMMGRPGQCVGVAPLRDGYAAAPPDRPSLGPLCREAVDLCRNPKFQEYIGHNGDAGFYWKPTEDAAKGFILAACGIQSRKELDTSSGAAQAFYGVRGQYLAWLRSKA